MGSGPVTSYYELKQPMEYQVTNEVCRKMLDVSPARRLEHICAVS